jgi:hypothetical protein
MRILIAAAAASLLAASAAQAQPARQYAIDEIAADLAYGFCPLFLAGQFPLDSPQLAERGFGTTVLKQPHPRVGEMSLVNAKHADGEIAFGGASGKACTVVVNSPSKRAIVLERLRSNMAFMGLDFETAAAPGPAPVAGLKVETFKAKVEAQFLYVQLIEQGEAGPVVAQLFVTEK